MTFGSLFAGIGGFDLGFERAGMRCVWQVEIDPYCRRVLAKHWPSVPRWDDVRTFTGEGFERPDVICGGFPCQDISNAGKRAGIGGERSGLWSEYARIIRLVRPLYIVVENVAALLNFGMDRVLGDLAACGYDSEWDCITAEAVGAPHERDRLFVVAHFESEHGPRRRPAGSTQSNTTQPSQVQGQASDVNGTRLPKSGNAGEVGASTRRIFERPAIDRSCWWAAEPNVVRMVHGVPSRVDRIRGLGNAVVPQVAEWIGRRILAAGPS